MAVTGKRLVSRYRQAWKLFVAGLDSFTASGEVNAAFLL